jgi:hypothetical protein
LRSKPGYRNFGGVAMVASKQALVSGKNKNKKGKKGKGVEGWHWHCC